MRSLGRRRAAMHFTHVFIGRTKPEMAMLPRHCGSLFALIPWPHTSITSCDASPRALVLTHALPSFVLATLSGLLFDLRRSRRCMRHDRQRLRSPEGLRLRLVCRCHCGSPRHEGRSLPHHQRTRGGRQASNPEGRHEPSRRAESLHKGHGQGALAKAARQFHARGILRGRRPSNGAIDFMRALPVSAFDAYRWARGTVWRAVPVLCPAFGLRSRHDHSQLRATLRHPPRRACIRWLHACRNSSHDAVADGLHVRPCTIRLRGCAGICAFARMGGRAYAPSLTVMAAETLSSSLMVASNAFESDRPAYPA